jgi:hypothetical protein
MTQGQQDSVEQQILAILPREMACDIHETMDDCPVKEAAAKLQQLLVEAQLHILRGFRRRDFVRDDFYEHAIIDRIAQLTAKEKE